MLAHCTYCSADKNYTELTLPAIHLYKSYRIKKIFEAAKKNDETFLILSGKYGLIHPSEEIKFYDHLLKENEISEHSKLIASQIILNNISAIEFYMNSVETDENVQVYLDCIKKACAKASIVLKINIIEFTD